MGGLNRIAGIALLLCVVGAAGVVNARDARLPSPMRGSTPRVSADNPAPRGPEAAMQASTTWLGVWDFNNGPSCSAEGWVAVDRTEQTVEYFHVDDFSGLGGGSFARLLPIQGNQSMWCGARPGTSIDVCAYATLPGYGNSWNQALCTSNCLATTGTVHVDFLASWDTEPGYDYFELEYGDCTQEPWSAAITLDDVGSTFLSGGFVTPASGQSKIRLRFHSDPIWSDEDALWDTDGAVIVDSLTVRDASGVVLATELFEAETVGDQTTVSGSWTACTPQPYGDFSGLFPAIALLQEDPCNVRFDCVWGFFNGSTYNYACGGYPSQAVVPYENLRSQYIWNEVWSPLIPLTGSGTSIELSYDAYFDNPIDPLVFGVWHIRSWVDGCPGPWRDNDYITFGTDGWRTDTFQVATMVDFGASHVQIAVGVKDMCEQWCGSYGTGNCHTHAPLYDSVSLARINLYGPQWNVEYSDLFQDTFASDGTTTGTARADAAVDVLPSQNINVAPGDSVSFAVTGGDVAMAVDPYTGAGAAVYLYVGVWPQGQPGKGGDALTQDPVRWPVVDSLTQNGDTWYCLRADTSFQGPGRTDPVVNEFCVDLNDNLFTPGDTVCFFLCSQNGPPESAYGYWSSEVGGTVDLGEVLTRPDEFTILPASGWKRGGDILYVDAFDGRGAQPSFDLAFRYWNIYDLVDRYDVRAPSLPEGNGPGSRVVDVEQQLVNCYRKIIWNTGNLPGAIGDGFNGEKSDDVGLLNDFLSLLPNVGGVWLSGDDIARDIFYMSSASAMAFKSYIGFDLINDNHIQHGLPVSPLIVGEPGGTFHDWTGVDSLTVYGGCPVINDFDVLRPTGAAAMQMRYGSLSGDGAVISQETNNPVGFNVNVVLSGFSYHYVDVTRSYSIGWFPPYLEHFGRILYLLGNVVVPGATDTPGASALDQNYPNPFNPTTTIRYATATPGPVQLKVYNVAGQLVRTLVNEHRATGPAVVEWDGRNNAGQRVSSGVYFYRLTAPDFTKTRKMVLLK